MCSTSQAPAIERSDTIEKRVRTKGEKFRRSKAAPCDHKDNISTLPLYPRDSMLAYRSISAIAQVPKQLMTLKIDKAGNGWPEKKSRRQERKKAEKRFGKIRKKLLVTGKLADAAV